MRSRQTKGDRLLENLEDTSSALAPLRLDNFGFRKHECVIDVLQPRRARQRSIK